MGCELCSHWIVFELGHLVTCQFHIFCPFCSILCTYLLLSGISGVTCSGPMESNKCVRQAECVSGLYEAEDGTCSKCSSSCKECLGDAETCTACKPGLFLSQNLHKCIPSCEEGFYSDSEGICRQCR